ncbi:hypothetical protein Tco_0889675 [Tanacetum coccineum]
MDLACIFWVAGANNDLTVLNHSPLFDDFLDDIAPVIPYEVNGVTFEKGIGSVDTPYVALSDVYYIPSLTMNLAYVSRLRWGSKSLRMDVYLPSWVSHDLRWISRLVYHDLYLGGKALVERENVDFGLTKSVLYPSFVEDHTAKGVGIRVRILILFKVQLSRLNPFGYAKLTTFAVMCKAYGCEPSVQLFKGFFDLFPGGTWLTFAKRPEKHISNLLPKVITRIEGWKGRFFFAQDFIVPVDCPELLSKDNRWDTKPFKDKLPGMIHENSFFQRLGRYPINVWTFPDPILFLAGLITFWEHDLSFPPKEMSPNFGTGSPSVSINTELPLVEVEPLDEAGMEQLVENVADSGDWFKPVPPLELFAKKPLPLKLTLPSLRGLMMMKILDLHNRCYARQAVVDNAVNRKAREFLKVVEQMRGECEVLKDREKARDKECEELKAKCEAAMADFDNNLAVNAGYQVSLSTLESKVSSLNAEKAKLEAVEASLRQDVEDLKRDRAEVVSKVVPYVAMKRVHSDELGRLVGKLTSSFVFYGRCAAFEEVAKMKEPFNLSKVKGYRSSYKKKHIKAGNDLATATFPFLSEVVADPFAPVEVLLSKKP